MSALPGPSKRKSDETPTDILAKKKNTDITNSSPRKRKLEQMIQFCKNKIGNQSHKIKRLQKRNQRLRKKITNIDEILTELEKKICMAKENLDCLKNTNVEVGLQL